MPASGEKQRKNDAGKTRPCSAKRRNPLPEIF